MSTTTTTSNFDIVAHYNDLISKDETSTPPIAAIESLISLLSSNPLTTVSETLDLLASQSTILLSSLKNPIPVSAGTDLFQRYLMSSFQQRSSSSLGSSDFTTLRQHLITNSRLFVQRAKQARAKIARYALTFIKDDSTIVTFGSSQVVTAALNHAAKLGRYFHVIFITPSTVGGDHPLNLPPNISVSTIPLHAFTYALSSLPTSLSKPRLLLGASAVLENGSTINSMGSHQLSILAQSFSIPVYVAVESYKFVRNFPLGHGSAELERMGVKQVVLRNTNHGPSEDEDDEDRELKLKRTVTASSVASHPGAVTENGNGYFGESVSRVTSKVITEEDEDEEMIEITPPNLISAIITENGIMTPNAVSEELIKLWF